MPNYTYKCSKCDKLCTVFQSIKEGSYKTCDQLFENFNCKDRGKVFRLISSNTGLIFKGSGFYLNDYSRKKNISKPKKNNVKPDKERGDVAKSKSSKQR